MTSGWSYESRTVWRLHDHDKHKARSEGMQPVLGGLEEEIHWNTQGYGIFATVQGYLPGERRTAKNCQKILSWAVDIDGGDKVEQRRRIKSAWQAHGLRPSAIVESRAGYHVYYNSLENPSIETFSEIMDRLIDLLGGDSQAKDLARTLRVPRHLNLKEPNKPFMVNQVYESTSRYTEEEILERTPQLDRAATANRGRMELKRALSFQPDGGLFERIWSLDQRTALNRLSGTAAVCGESYTFKGRGSHGYRIEVNGQPTSCWIDRNGKIGSLTGGGPTIWQWVNWLQRDHKTTYQLLKQHLPEVFNDRR